MGLEADGEADLHCPVLIAECDHGRYTSNRRPARRIIENLLAGQEKVIYSWDCEYIHDYQRG